MNAPMARAVAGVALTCIAVGVAAGAAGANDVRAHDFAASGRIGSSTPARDRAGGATAYLLGGASYVAGRSGAGFSSASFGLVGGGSEVRVTDPSVANFGRAPFTIVLDVNVAREHVLAPPSEDLISKRASCNFGSFFDLRMSPDGSVVGTIDGGSIPDYTTARNPTAIDDGRWHQVIFARDAGDLMVTVDGDTTSVQIHEDPSIDNRADLRIGASPCAGVDRLIPGGDQHLDGLIDAVVINPDNLADGATQPDPKPSSSNTWSLVVGAGAVLVVIVGLLAWRTADSSDRRPDSSDRRPDTETDASG